MIRVRTWSQFKGSKRDLKRNIPPTVRL